MLESLFNKVAGLRPANFLKRESNTVFFCEICEIFKNTYFEEHLRMTDCFSDLKQGIRAYRFKENSHLENCHLENFHPLNSPMRNTPTPGKFPTGKLSPRIFPPISLTTHFIICKLLQEALPSFNTSFINRGRGSLHVHPPP